MSVGERQGIAAQICQRVSWELPQLQESAMHDAVRKGDYDSAALGIISYMRKRETPRLGYSRTYAARLRERGGPELLALMTGSWEKALKDDFLMPYHGNAFAALGAEAILLAATPDLCRRTAARVMECQERWSEGYWGVTHSICDLLRFLWPLEECADQDLLPLFGWLLEKSEVEWKSSRTWDETTLGISGHNWWAHTLFGFWMFGTFFPEFKGAEGFRALAPDYLERELSLLFEDDGWSKEGSPGYHEFAAGNLMAFAHLAELNGVVLSESVRLRLRLIADASWRLVAPDGDYPLFGDFVRRGQYSGFHGQNRADRSTCNVLRTRAARFSLGQAKFVAEALDTPWKPFFGDLLPDEGQNALAAYQKLAMIPAAPDTCLPRSGFYVIRQNWTPRADCAAIVAGPLGSRVTSHKHADIFHFELFCRGRRILVDNGYGPIRDERKDDRPRMWRVSSGAHNVSAVDGEDHVQILREFDFGSIVIPIVDDWRTGADYAYFSGVHEGYLRLPEKVTAVRRKLFYLRGRYWILLDRFTAPSVAEHEYQIHFQLNAPATLRSDGWVTTSGKGGNLLLLPTPGAAGRGVLSPNPYPVENYENPQHLCYTHRVRGNALLATLLIPFEDEAVPEVSVSLAEVESDGRNLEPWEATGLRIAIDGEEHFYFDQHMQWNLPWKSGKYQGRGRLFHSACSL